MSGYKKTILVGVEIEGTKHEVALRPMRFEESLDVYDAGAGFADNSKESRRGQRVAAVRLLPTAILSVTPPILAEGGEEVTAEEFCSATYFASIVRDLMDAWIAQSQPANP